MTVNRAETMALDWRIFPAREALVAQLLADTLASLSGVITEAGAATWAVSGGGTPAPLFELAAKTSFSDAGKSLWPLVHICLVDERWVARTHPRSNEAFMRSALETGETKSAHFVGMKTEQATPQDGIREVEERYQGLPPVGPLLLGMGGDGHTASLFPQADGLGAALQTEASTPLTAAITARRSDVTGEEVMRATLTLAAIKAARFPHLMIVGEAKKQALEAAIAGGTLPVARVTQALPVPLPVYWAP